MASDSLFKRLGRAARPFYPEDDPAHDWNHICRVFAYAHRIHAAEGGDLCVIATAVFFHDCVNLPKNHPSSNDSPRLSAEAATKELLLIDDFPRDKIPLVATCIREHSYSGGIVPTALESKIVQDADRLESTGLISLARTFASSGVMGKPLFNWRDPLCEQRDPAPKSYALDLAFSRLLKVSETLNTDTAKLLAIDNDRRLQEFIALFKEEVALFPTTETFPDIG